MLLCPLCFHCWLLRLGFAQWVSLFECCCITALFVVGVGRNRAAPASGPVVGCLLEFPQVDHGVSVPPVTPAAAAAINTPGQNPTDPTPPGTTDSQDELLRSASRHTPPGTCALNVATARHHQPIMTRRNQPAVQGAAQMGGMSTHARREIRRGWPEPRAVAARRPGGQSHHRGRPVRGRLCSVSRSIGPRARSSSSLSSSPLRSSRYS